MKKYIIYYLIVITLIAVGFTCNLGYERQFVGNDGQYNRYQYAFIRL